MDITFRDLNGLKHDMNVLLSSLEELAVTEENQQEIIALIEEMQKEDKYYSIAFILTFILHITEILLNEWMHTN